MTKKKPQDAKSEFLAELVERYSYWNSRKKTDYAKAYERLIYAFTSPSEGNKRTTKTN